MGKAERCIVCKKEVDWEKVTEEFEWLFEQVDFYGEESLTESMQWVYRGKVCSVGCYDLMK